MTINLLTWVPEGIVLLTDSMSTSETFIPFQGAKVTTFDHARKLFEIGSHIRAAAMISGVGDIGGTLVSQLLKQASRNVDAMHPNPVVHVDIVREVVGAIDPVYEQLVNDLKQQVLAQIRQDPNAVANANKVRDEHGQPEIAEIGSENIGVANAPNPENHYYDFYISTPTLNVVIASHIGNYEACTMTWPGPMQDNIFQNAGIGNLWWWGSGGSAVSRLVRGFDMGLLQAEADANDPDATNVLQFAVQRVVRYQMPHMLSVMPLQEAVYFTEYLGDVAVGYDRFKAGPAGVGGAIDVMAITDEGRQWLRRDVVHSRPVVV